LHCLYCRPRALGDPAPRADLLGPEDLLRFVRVARRSLGVTKVRLTGGEPLVRPDLVDIVAALGSLGLPDLALTTNGQNLAEQARSLRAAGLDRVNVSMDSLDQGTFARLARGGQVARTMAGIEAALAAGLHPVRINTVVLRGLNDHEAEAIVDFALERGCEPRFIELMPSGLLPADYQRWFMSSAELHERLARSFVLAPETHVLGSSSRRFRVTSRGHRGWVGFIAPNSHPFCAGCRRLRLTADGRLYGCLGRAEHVGIGGLLRAQEPGSDERIAAAMHVALGCKRGAGPLEVATPMSRIGG